MARTEDASLTPTSRAFESDVEAALSALQAALGAAVDALDEHPRKATDLMRQLDLERNLAWKIFRLIHERDIFVAARFVPGAASIDAFITAAAAAGADSVLMDRVRDAAASYDKVLRLHAGDRVSADIMLGNRGGEAAELALRRAGFRAASALAGVQAQVQVQTFVMAPSASGDGSIDGVAIKGFVDLRRMRPNAPVVIGRAMSTDDSGMVIKTTANELIDPAEPDQVVPLLTEFCSSPLPRFRRVPADPPFIEYELVEGPVGRTGAATFMSATVVRALGSLYRDENNKNLDTVTRIRTPAEVLVCDVLVRSDQFPHDHPLPRAALYSEIYGEALRRGPSRERYRLAWSEKVEHLGRGLACAQSADVPRYPKMLQHVMDRLEWDGAAFDVYRVRIEYPYTPTSLVVSFDLLDPT
jgi:hypothetical protein